MASGTSFQYDAAGNVTFDGYSHNYYLYDAESRLCAVNSLSNPTSQNPGIFGYVYDAEGTRVAMGALAHFTCDFNPADTYNSSTNTGYNGFTARKSWVLGPGGEQLTEYSISGATSTWVHSNAFADGALLATYRGSDTVFALNDWLGTKRAEAGASGCVTDFQSMPFGNELNPVTATGYTACTDATEHHFTGKERDTESGNDYFEARYYSSVMGRFLSPDWSAKEEPVPYAKLEDPQSLNLYAYVRNNPTTGIDLDGHCNPNDWGCNSWSGSGNFAAKESTEQANLAAQKQAQQQIANNAVNQEGSATYEYGHSKGSYPAGTNKCNEFVADTVASSGAARPQVPRSGILGWFGLTRDPTAKEWATMSIAGWSAPDSVAHARPGDVIAMGHHDDNEGHVGIVVGPGLTASVNANTRPGGIVTVNTWGFRATGGNQEHPGDVVVVRHYIGDGQ